MTTSTRAQIDRGSAADGLDQLAQRAVDAVLRLVRRASALAGRRVCFLAISDQYVVRILPRYRRTRRRHRNGVGRPRRSVFAFIAIMPQWPRPSSRLRSVRKIAPMRSPHRDSLADSPATRKRNAPSSRPSNRPTHHRGDSVVAVSRQFFSLQSEVGDRSGQFKSLGRSRSHRPDQLRGAHRPRDAHHARLRRPQRPIS